MRVELIMEGQTEFNNAFGYIERLDKIFYMIAESKFNKNSKNYIRSLFLLFDELSTEMTPEDVEAYKNKLRRLEEELFSLNNTLGIPKTIYYDLQDLELKFRQIYNKSGLMMKRKLDPSNALGGNNNGS